MLRGCHGNYRSRTRHTGECPQQFRPDVFQSVAGTARVHIGGEQREITAPAVAFVPRQTDHHVENIGDTPLQYIYVSIWPGKIPVEDGLSWREASEAMIRMYNSRGYSPQRSV